VAIAGLYIGRDTEATSVCHRLNLCCI